MFGLTFIDFVRFIMQAGLAFAGASALWGWFYSWKKKPDVSKLLFRSLYAGLAIYYLALLLSITVWPETLFAHEGVSIKPTQEYLIAGFWLIAPLMGLILIGALLGPVFEKRKKQSAFFGVLFMLIALAISFQAYRGVFDTHQTFFSLHNIHSIFTLGTVLTVDYLYVMSSIRPALKRSMYPFFNKMSAVIWMGLGLDFLSVYPIFEEAFRATPKFYFAQTVVAIIVINGALLAGKITDELNKTIAGTTIQRLPPKVQKIAGVSGAISIVSWLTITFIDFFPDLSISYPVLLALYAAAIFVAWISEKLIMLRVTPST